MVASPVPQTGSRYELVSLLAQGGMGQVHLGRMRGPAGFQKLVVIKRNLPAGDDSARGQMLFNEARLVATLHHANIVQVYDVGHDGDAVFIAMEFLHGQDLRAVAQRSWGAGQPLALDFAVAAMLAVCAGLHYAHDRRDENGIGLGIVHRDVSPSNVFATYDGTIKLIDFGIAKATSLPSETQLGTIKGKPGYMSPEQCNGDAIDRRSDVFCAGILLYELTTGRRPFARDTEYLTMRAILEEEPIRPTALDPSYPAELEAIVLRAITKDRKQRYASAAEMQDALAGFARAHKLDVSPYEVARVMNALFAAELVRWRDAQQAGQVLEDYIVRRSTEEVPALAEPSIEVVFAPTGKATVIEPAPPRPRPRRGRFAIVAGAVAIAGALTAVIAMRGSPTPPPPAPERAVVTQPTPRPPAPVPVAPEAPGSAVEARATTAVAPAPTPTPRPKLPRKKTTAKPASVIPPDPDAAW